MKGFFGFGSKLKNKLTASKFEYTFIIHSLQPWPAGDKAIAIGWQRGSKRRGATRSVYPSTALGKVGNVVRFNEKFDVSATLYKANTGSSSSSALGPFKKKCIILAVLETDGRTQATAALGRVVIDLSEFAAVDHQETRTFQAACNKAIHAAVGDPQLTITIRCRWKRSSGMSGTHSNDMDDIGSVSTDTTGSRMTQNLSSFLRFKHGAKGQVNEEQDLQGFEKSHKSQPPGQQDLDKNYMGTIQESHEEANSPPKTVMGVVAPRTTPVNTITSTHGFTTKPHVDIPAEDDVYLRPVIGDIGAPRGGVAAGHRTSLSPVGQPRLSPVGGLSSSLRDAYGNGGPPPGAAAAMTGFTPPSSRGAVTPRSMTEEFPSASNSMTALELQESRPRWLSGADASAMDTVRHMLSASGADAELLSSAATEVCVYLAQVSTSGKRPSRNTHAPARRLARTVVCMGPSQGSTFGKFALRLIQNQVRASNGDLGSLMFWWSNVVHMKALLQASADGQTRWAAEALGPQLAQIERTTLFDQLLTQLWETVLMPAVTTGGAASKAAAAGGKPVAATKRAMQEAAIKRWFEGLDEVNRQLGRLGNKGHAALLKQQVLSQCLKRVDALLFYHLLTMGDEATDIMTDYDPANSLWGGPGVPIPGLEEASLPFSRGLLTFGSGMSVKMTVTRLQQWATSEGILGSDGRAVAESSSGLFPLLRAAADLLMMPKELLMEQAIRRDVCQALSMRCMIHIVERFQPDEYAHDPINPEIIDTLKEEQLHVFSPRPPLTDLSVGYKSPADDILLHNVLVGQEPGLDYEADSEDELELLGSLASATDRPTTRYTLLHELWAQGTARRRKPSAQSLHYTH